MGGNRGMELLLFLPQLIDSKRRCYARDTTCKKKKNRRHKDMVYIDFVKKKKRYFFSLYLLSTTDIKMMMHKLKKILKLEKGVSTEEKTTSKKKKRFSLLLKTAMIDPDDDGQEGEKIMKKPMSKSSSFLQLQSFTATPLKRSRSMFGQLCSNDHSKNGVSVTTEEDNNNTSSAILDYYAASENILHTAAVSISSTYNPSHDMLDRDDGEKDLLLGIASYEKGELEQASYHWKVAAESESPLAIFFYGLALRHGWVKSHFFLCCYL